MNVIMIKFSIIVPIYNIEKYLEDCLKSIVEQTYTNFEVILVDDGSTDRCPQICDECSKLDERFITIHKKNGGLVSARKAGAKVAVGDYVICLDGDDLLTKDCLSVYAEIIEMKSPDIICTGHYDVIDFEKHRFEITLQDSFYCREDIENKILPSLLYQESGEALPLSIWGKAYKRDIYVEHQLKLTDKIKIAEDVACVAPLIWDANSVFVSSLCTYYYRHNTDSMTKNRKPFSWDGPKLVFEHLQKEIDLSQYNFEQQLYNRTTHSLFNVVKTQFYRKESYASLKREIDNNLNDTIYHEAIIKSRYFGLFRIIMKLSLKYRIYFLIFLYSRR